MQRRRQAIQVNIYIYIGLNNKYVTWANVQVCYSMQPSLVITDYTYKLSQKWSISDNKIYLLIFVEWDGNHSGFLLT